MREFKLALITGATSGIGLSLAELLADKGINLILTGRNQKILDELSERLQKKVNVTAIPSDLGYAKNRKELIQKIYELGPDLVINNAGIGVYGDSIEVDTAKQLEVVDIDVLALTEISIETAKAWASKEKMGVIMNISSVAGFAPFPCFSTYGAAKAYVNSFSQALDYELKGKGIRVLTSCPGQVETNFSIRASEGRYSHAKGTKISPQFAAEEIWWQIQKEKPLHAFDWKYRVALALIRYLIPKSLVLSILNRRVRDRIG